jgi:hypothetical protein
MPASWLLQYVTLIARVAALAHYARWLVWAGRDLLKPLPYPAGDPHLLVIAKTFIEGFLQ